MRKIVSGIMLILLLTSVLFVMLDVPVVVASGTIYIRADGSIDPPTAPIQRNGDIYTLTGNIYDYIVVQRNNIVVDGAGYTVQGTGLTIGTDNVTIKNVEIKACMQGVTVMELINLIAIIISVVSLIVSLYVGIKITRFNEASIRRASRLDYTRLLVDLDRILIDEPKLWAMFDSHPLSKKKTSDPEEKARRDAFIYLHFNIFDIVHDFYMHIIGKKRRIDVVNALYKCIFGKERVDQCEIDADYWKSWDRYIRQVLEGSSEARAIFKDPKTREAYSNEFADYVSKIINEIESRA
jgi:hypothetical protein